MHFYSKGSTKVLPHDANLKAKLRFLLACYEAFAAENWLATFFLTARFEGDLALRTALGTHGIMQLTSLVLTLIATVFASLWCAQVL